MKEIGKNGKRWRKPLWTTEKACEPASPRACASACTQEADWVRACTHVTSHAVHDIPSRVPAHMSCRTARDHIARLRAHLHVALPACLLSTCIPSAVPSITVASCTLPSSPRCMLPRGKHAISPPWLFKTLPLHFSSPFPFTSPLLHLPKRV